MSHNRNTLIKSLLLFFGFSASLLFSQSPTSSPYSRFGLGDMEKKGFGQSNALGGSYIGLINDTIAPLFINAGNPASYPSLRFTTFEVGVQDNYSTFMSKANTVTKNNAGLNYMSLGFPVGRRGGGAFGVTPFSNVGYNITNQTEEANIGTVKQLYQGSGGANQLFVGYGIRPFFDKETKFRKSATYKTLRDSGDYKTLKRKRYLNHTLSTISIGANAFYMFGNINHTGVIVYPTNPGVYNTKRSVDTQIRDFNGTGGIQVSFDLDSLKKRDLKKNVRFTLGYNISLPRAVNATSSTVATTFIYGPFQHEYVQDTVLNNSNVHGKIVLPLIHGFGFCFKKGNNLTVLGDVEMQMWSGYKYFDETNTFKNAMRYSVGAQFVPNRLAVGDGAYFKKIQYRIGARYTDGYINLKNTKIADYAVTAGLGLPMGRYRLLSTVNLSVEMGRVGTIENNLIQQKYFRAVIGFTFNDRWFIKTKYD